MEKGKIYPCSCSRKDIERAQGTPHYLHVKPVYPGTCRPGKANNHQWHHKPCQPFAWRFRINHPMVAFHDSIYGSLEQNLAKEAGDFVMKRKDRLFACQPATVVADIQMGDTDVVRGEDLPDSTGQQITLYKAPEESPENHWHIPLFV